MSDVEKTVEDTPETPIIVIRERPMWAIYIAFVIVVAAITFGVMELLFGG